MTDVSTDVVQNHDPIVTSTPETSNVAPETHQERTFTQSELNKMMGHARREGHESGRKAVQSEYEQYKGASADSQPHVAQQSSSMGGMTQVSPDVLEKMVASAAQQYVEKQSQAMTAQRILDEFGNKMKQGSTKYNDFDDTVAQLRLDQNPLLVVLANGADNSADVIYDLGKNPHKVGVLLSLANNPATSHLAQAELQRLSKSIKDNQVAQSQGDVPDPVGRVKPSTTGTDSGKMSIRDMRKLSYLRA